MATVPVAKLLLCCDIICKHSKSTQLASGVTARLGKKMTTGVYIYLLQDCSKQFGSGTDILHSDNNHTHFCIFY